MLWRCNVCGYLHEDKGAPDKCPKCGALKDQFVKLGADAEKLVTRSRFTNDLHMKIESKLRKIAELAELGVKDDLDQPCAQLFAKEKEFALSAMQMIKAELESHVKKGKWG